MAGNSEITTTTSEVVILPESPPPPPPPLRPLESSERVPAIDILRGLALFGILAANIRGFAGPAQVYFSPHLYWPSFPDRLAQAFIDAFIQGKFITIFAFLFGVGFAVQLERARTRTGRFGWVYSRRLLVLMVFGLIHGLYIWFGDILLIYGAVGFLLFFFRNARDKTLLTWAVVLFFVPLMMMGLFIFGSMMAGEKPPGPPPPTAEDLRRITEVFRNGSWSAIQMQRAGDALQLNWGFAAFGFAHFLSLFLFGLLAWRRRFFNPAVEALPLYRRAMAWGLSVGIAGNVVDVVVRWTGNLPMFDLTPRGLVLVVLRSLSTVALSLGYMCAVILLCQHHRLQRYGAIGRTALSNYLLQSVVGTLLFYSYGLGLFGRMGPAMLIIPTIAIYAVQVVLSQWWLARWRFGPVEWLWRRLAYGRRTAVATSATAPEPL